MTSPQSNSSACSSSSSLPNLGDLGTLWHNSAPGEVRRAYQADQHSQGWDAWSKHLGSPKRASDLVGLPSTETSSLGWSLCGSQDELKRIERAGKDGSADDTVRAVEAWLTDLDSDQPQVGSALEAIAWAQVLPGLARQIEADPWWKLLNALVGLANDAEALDLDTRPLLHQLLAGELAWTLAGVLPEISACRKLTSTGRKSLSTGLVDLLDGNGLPQSRHLDRLYPLLACWTRCRRISESLPKGGWSEDAQSQYEWLVRAVLRLTRPDGVPVLSNGSADPTSLRSLATLAIDAGGDADDRDIATLALVGSKKSAREKIDTRELPDPSVHSQWAGIAVMQSGWDRKEPRLAVSYDQHTVRTELTNRRDTLWSGSWDLEVRVDGKILKPVSNWSEVCWISDEDVDYLELEIELEQNVHVQRSMALAHDDGFVFLADAVLGEKAAKLEYRGSLPLAPGVTSETHEETRELLLLGRKPRANVLPLALSEWRVGDRFGSLNVVDDRLTLTQKVEAQALFAPMFLDLRSGMRRRKMTWRQLTIGENLEVQGPDRAVGYRVQLGKNQWLVYRSLAEATNRTVLGHNLTSEMLIARFYTDGEVEPLAEIE